MNQLKPNEFYVLTPKRAGDDAGSLRQVLGPFKSHREGHLARRAWAYDSEDVSDRAELLTGAQLAADYGGRYGKIGQEVANV